MENKFACNVVEMFLGAIVSKTTDIIVETTPSMLEDVAIKFMDGDYLYINYREEEGEFYISYQSRKSGKYKCSRLVIPEKMFGYFEVQGDVEHGIKAIDHWLGEDLAYSIYNRLKWTTLHV